MIEPVNTCSGRIPSGDSSSDSTLLTSMPFGEDEQWPTQQRTRRQRRIRRPRQVIPVMCHASLFLVLLLLAESRAQLANRTEEPTDATATGAPSTVTTTIIEEDVCDPAATCAAGGVFIMSFVLLSASDEEATMSSIQSALFQDYMANLTERFAPPEDYPLVDTTCLFFFEDSKEVLPLVVPLPEDEGDGESAAAENEDPPNRIPVNDIIDNNNATNRFLKQQLQQYLPADNKPRTRVLQDIQLALTTSNESLVAEGATLTNATSSLFQYIFRMDYQSQVVDVSTYPVQFVEYTTSELTLLSLELALLLGIEPTERVNIQDIRELAPLANPAEVEAAATFATSAPASGAPTISPPPSMMPSLSNTPTITPQPTGTPTSAPTGAPSVSPSAMPTVYPTFLGGTNVTAVQYYSLDFALEAGPREGFMNTTEQAEFCAQMVALTAAIAPETYTRVVTKCAFLDAISKLTAPALPLQTAAPIIEVAANASDSSGGGSSSTNPDLDNRRLQLRRHNNVMRSSAEMNPDTPYRIATLSDLETSDMGATSITTRGLQNAGLVTIYTYFFSMTYTSASENVTGYPIGFQLYLVANAEEFNERLTDILGLEAENNLTFTGISVYEINTDTPSVTPSLAPSFRPTVAVTSFPTLFPTKLPSSEVPTDVPSSTPSTDIVAPSDSNDAVVIVVSVVCGLIFLAMLIGLVLLYKKRQSKLDSIRAQHRAAANTYQGGNGNGDGGNPYKVQEGRTEYATFSHDEIHSGGYTSGQPYDTVATSPLSTDYHNNGRYPNGNLMIVHSTSESILSNPSLLSNGQDDDDEFDGDLHGDDDDLLERSSKMSPLDDFDRFKDQKLEDMRSSVEASVAGIDGMMSQALTMALMDGGNPSVGMLWDGAMAGDEIEANALCEVTDWMKRHDFASFDEQQSFMQIILNKMVISVRQGFIGPEDASRTIHECASLLNLQLATQLPVTCIILSGMRKTATANDVTRAFRGFGVIDDAAVASNERGFGLVRFRNPRAIAQVMIKFRTAEIVVQDVAVQVKVLGQDL